MSFWTDPFRGFSNLRQRCCHRYGYFRRGFSEGGLQRQQPEGQGDDEDQHRQEHPKGGIMTRTTAAQASADTAVVAVAMLSLGLSAPDRCSSSCSIEVLLILDSLEVHACGRQYHDDHDRDRVDPPMGRVAALEGEDCCGAAHRPQAKDPIAKPAIVSFHRHLMRCHHPSMSLP